MTYKEQLKTKKWKRTRNRILKRDKNKCTKCNNKDKLQIHHTYYRYEHLAWEYPDTCLITLCGVCHEKEHKEKEIPVKAKTKHKKVKKSQREKLISKLSKEDRELNLRYERLKH